VVPDAAAANKPRASLRMGASLARFRRCLLFGSAKSRGTVRLIKTSFANYSPMLEWDFVKSGASPGVRGDVKHSAYWWFDDHRLSGDPSLGLVNGVAASG
jgi:hypothetical protein